MSFPSTPRNNQLVAVNGIIYIYNQTDDAWTKYGTTSANLITTDTANVTSNTSSTSTTTGALQVAGGLGVQGNIFAGAVYTNSYFFANGAAFSGSGAGSTGFTGSAGAGFTGSFGTTGFAGSAGFTGSTGAGFTGSVGFVGSSGTVGFTGSFGITGFTGSFGVFSGNTDSAVDINNSTASVSTTTGALTVAGGAGIAGSLYVGNASVISVNSASTALRITQTGAGNALVVEDSVNPDATPFVIDNAGLVGLGIALPTAKLHVTGLTKAGGILVETANTSSAAPAIEVIGKRSDGNSFAAFSGKVLLGGNRTDAAVGANKLLGAVAFGGNHTDGLLANLLYTASISGIAEGTFTDAATMPTGLVFLTGSVGTTADSTTVSMGTERMRISNAGVTTITGTAIINANATTDALRITQTGAGNALLVEDSANPDATPFLINNAGVVISGSTSSITGYAGSPTQQTSPIEVMGGNSAGTGLAIFGFSSATVTARATVNFNKSQSTTIGTHVIVTSDETLGAIHFSGSDGTNYIPAAQIYAHTDGTPGTNIMPGRLVFSTTSPGDNLPTERVRITSDGYVGIDTTNPRVKLEVAGSNDQVWQVTASISGTTMDVTAVTSGNIAVDDLVFGINVQPYTRITALGTGTGGIGTYTVSVFQTVASTANMFGSTGYGDNIIRITETDGGQNQGQPTGALQFFTSDNSTPGAGVGAYVAALAESTSPDTALVFGTRDNTGGGVDANERMRIGSAGTVSITTAIGATSTTTGAFTVTGGAGIAGNVWAGAVYSNNYFYANGSAFSGAIGYTGSAGTGGSGSGNGYTGSQGVPGTLASGQITNTFTGNGSTTAFTLSVAPVSKDAVTVNIDGVTQQRSGYTVNGFILTLDEAPLSGEVVEVTVATYGTTNFVTRTYTGNGSTANYAVTLGATVDSVIVTENGVVQTPTSDYTITGNVLSFVGGAPAVGTAIGVREIPAGAVGGNSVYSRTSITATAGQTSFAVAYTVGFLAVYFNGALLNAIDYTATNGSTVVLTDAAAVGDIVEFITYNVVPVTQVPVATFNSTNLSANLAITAGYSAVSVGPINIADGVSISIADGQKWVIL